MNVDKAIDFAKVYATEKENIEIVSKSLNIELENSNEIVDMLKNIYDVDSTYFAGLKVLYLKGKKESVESAIEFVQSLLESQPPKEAKFKVLNVAATDQLKNILAELTDLQVFTYQEKTILYGTQDSISKAEEIINNIISENVVTRIETNLDYEQVQKFVAFLFGEDVKVINIGNSIYFKGPKIYVDEVIKQINLISSSESVKSEEENKNNIFVKDNLINIDVSDAPLADVIKTIYSQLGYSIVVDGIEDKITLKLENASIEDFEKIISEKVSIEKENNFISIKPKESENAQVVSDEIVKYENGLFSIDAEDVPVDELIREVMKKVGYSAIISKDINIRSNIFAKDITFDNFINILNNYNISVDKKDDIYFFNETTTEATQNIDKFIFSVPRGSEKVKQLVAFYGGQTFVDTESGMVIATGISAKSASEIKEYIESLLEVKLASIEVKVIDEDMNDSAELDLGKISTALGELSNNGLSINLALSDLSFEKIAEKILNSGNSNIDMTNSTISKTLSNSNIVANPNVVAKSGETANIIIGDRLPIILKDAEGNESIQYLQSGVILEITPFINADNTIDLKLRIEVSTFDWEVGASSVSKLPVEKTREFRSSLTLKNGQTLIIGGLTRDEKITSTSKLPILGDLPIIGKFFSKQSEKFTKRNLIIFITAKVIE